MMYTFIYIRQRIKLIVWNKLCGHKLKSYMMQCLFHSIIVCVVKNACCISKRDPRKYW